MSILRTLMIVAVALYGSAWITNRISYHWLKKQVVSRHARDLNVCGGLTDGGGVNADIVTHTELPNVVQLDVYNLPFGDKQFARVLCSHTLEHVDDVKAFYRELDCVSKDVTLLLPPLWDWSAALNVLEHKWLLFTFRTERHTLPLYVRLPLARRVQRTLGQRIHA